jgi:small conductance mechanosensitive channel
MRFDITFEQVWDIFNTFTTQIIQVVMIFVVFTILKKVGIKLLTRLFLFKIGKLKRTTPESLKQKETIKQLTINVFKYAINLLKLVLVISVFIPITTLMASVGAFALIITFGFQNMMGDIVRGFFIIFEEMFMVGDWIEVAGFQGEVLEIGLRTTKLRLFRTGEIVLIPNNNIANIIRLDIDRLIKERDAALTNS